jgi:hypothetical protein
LKSSFAVVRVSDHTATLQNAEKSLSLARINPCDGVEHKEEIVKVRAGVASVIDPVPPTDLARVTVSAEQRRIELLAPRVRAEYLEMPGLCLTLEQAQRLWNVERRTCEALLESLIDARFLHRTERQLFVLRGGHVLSKECA